MRPNEQESGNKPGAHSGDANADWISHLQAGLREATRDLHHRLDHSPRLAALVRPGLTVATYGLALQALYAINMPTECRIADYIHSRRLSFNFDAHRRMHDLEADLIDLDLAIPHQAWNGPEIDSPGALVGCFYVLAGSTLGGRVIFRQLQTMLPFNQLKGARFFAGHGDQTMSRWQEFWNFAADICPCSQLPVAQESAAALFANILLHLESQSS